MLNPDQFHPHVDHYRDGGMGGIGEDHSVVGMVPTHLLAKYREHGGDWNGSHSAEVVDSLRADIRSGKGITNPLMLHYDHKNQWAYLGEGNHRLRAGEEEHVPYMPVRVVRSGDLSSKRDSGVGAPASHNDPGWSRPGYPYVPSDMHPSYLNLGD